MLQSMGLQKVGHNCWQRRCTILREFKTDCEMLEHWGLESLRLQLEMVTFSDIQ